MRMNAIILTGAFALAWPRGPGHAAVPKATHALAVWPRIATSLPVSSLGDFVAKALPRDGKLGWDWFRNGVLWQGKGLHHWPRGPTTRMGIARIRASGRAARIKRRRWEELAWNIELSTDGDSRLGPTSITIEPGFNIFTTKENYSCFGRGYDGCDFLVAALDTPRMKLSRQCKIGEADNYSIVMIATTPDGRRGTVVFTLSSGSGGASSDVEITTMTARDYCRENRNRGF